MVTAPTYIIQRAVYRILDFLRHWYFKSAKMYWHFVINQFEKIDYTLAWKITLKYLFTPLYKDYSTLGYILGFILRSGRLVVASFIYAILFALAGIVYVIWLLIPVIIIAQIFGI